MTETQRAEAERMLRLWQRAVIDTDELREVLTRIVGPAEANAIVTKNTCP